MKKSLMKKLYLSIFTLVFAVVSLGTTTFAWFTVGGTFEVEAFESNLKAGQGIEVGVGGLTSTAPESYYVSALPENTLKNIIETKNKLDTTKKWAFDAVTPVVSDNKITGWKTITTNGTETDVDSTDFITNGYVGYKLYIKADASGFVYFDNLKISPKGASQIDWAAGVEYELNQVNKETSKNYVIKASDPLKYDILSSARLAFLTDSALTVYEEGTVNYQSGIAGNSTGFCPTYASTGTSKVGSTYIFAKKYNLGSMGKAAPYETAKLVNSDVEGKQTLSFASDSVYKVAVTANSSVCISVYLWVEGWDAECVNAILAQGLSMSYTLTYEANERE